jgi:WD40 repeat protein
MNTALPRRVSWDPHDSNNILATSGVDVVAFDMRCAASSTGLGVINSAHRYGVADICHNHLQPNVIVTSGMDSVMKFWDLRMHLSNSLDSPSFQPPLLKTVRGGHSHWMTRATYNPFHDQLVLSGGSDGIANLWRISSCSSAPLLELNDEDEDDGETSRDSEGDDEVTGNEKRTENRHSTPEVDGGELKFDAGNKSPTTNSAYSHDIRVTRFECSDVTADIAWSTTDPWVYATLSHDGAVVVHHVPSKEKYKILL